MQRCTELQVKQQEVSRTHRSVVIQQPRSAPPDVVKDISERVAQPSLDHHGFATASDEELHAERLTGALRTTAVATERSSDRLLPSTIT